MTRHQIINIVAFLLIAGSVHSAGAAGAPPAIPPAIAALKAEPTNAARFDALARVAAAADATPEQARALAICYLGYRLAGQSDYAKNAKTRLDSNHPNSAYRAAVQDEHLFNSQICPDCNGEGVMQTPCPKCNAGRCVNCNGDGTKEGISSRITCTVCRGTGKCKACNGTGTLDKRCSRCRGTGNLVEFKRDETQELYLSLLETPLEAASGEKTPPGMQASATGNAPILLDASQITKINEAYQAATSLNKHTVYQAFLRQIGSGDETPSPLLLKIPDGGLFLVHDVSIGKIKGGDPYYYATLVSANNGRTRLIIPGSDKAFAASLQKGTQLTATGWVSQLKTLPPWGSVGDKTYRSVSDYLLLQDN